MKKTPDVRFSAAQLGWLLLELALIGERVQAQGMCLGELRPRQVGLRHGRLVRLRDSYPLDPLWNRIAVWRHASKGHDASCYLVGISRSAASRLLVAWGGAENAQFVVEVLDELGDELAQSAPRQNEIKELLTHLVGRRITVCAPTDQVIVLE